MRKRKRKRNSSNINDANSADINNDEESSARVVINHISHATPTFIDLIIVLYIIIKADQSMSVNKHIRYYTV